jgi:hypothetical protein
MREPDLRDAHRGIGVAQPPGMSSAAPNLTPAYLREPGEEEPLPTRKVEKFHLEQALAAMDRAARETTDPATIGENKRLIMRAFRFDDADGVPTVDAPAAPTARPPSAPDLAANAANANGVDVDVDLDLDLPPVSSPPPVAPAIAAATDDLELSVERASLVSSGVHLRPIPAAVAAHASSAVLRSRVETRAASNRTRWIVIAIWTVTVTLAAGLAFVAATSDPPPIHGSGSAEAHEAVVSNP